MIRRIAFEEAFVSSEIAIQWKKVSASNTGEAGSRKIGESIYVDSPANSLLHQHLLEKGATRTAHMDCIGISIHVLSLASRGVQVFDALLANCVDSESNDMLADADRRYPNRFEGL